MTAIEFVQKKINPRITAEYDISLTGQQLFDLLDEYAAIAEAMPETTELIAVSFKSERFHEPVLAYFETACCKVSPIYNESFCPSCGRRIKK